MSNHVKNQFRKGLSLSEYKEKMLKESKKIGLTITRTPMKEFCEAVKLSKRSVA